MKKIKVLGIGPGHPDYCLPIVKRLMEECDVLVGGKRQLATFAQDERQKTIRFTYPMDPMMKEIETLAEFRNVGVLVSGDAGFYSLLAAMVKRFGVENLAVYPGVSSLQVLFSKLSLPWDQAELGSLHGREWPWLERVKARKTIGLLTDAKQSPQWIAWQLVHAGIEDCWMAIGENLSYPDERIHILRPEEARKRTYQALSVVVIYDDK